MYAQEYSQEGEVIMKQGRAVGLMLSIATAATMIVGPVPSAMARSNSPLIPLTVAYMPNMGGASTLAVAMQKGFFTQAGLDVKLQQFQTGPDEFDAMASGTVSIAYIGSGASYLPMEGRAKIFMIDSIGLGDGVVVSKSSGVTTLAQLKGKDVLLPMGTTAEIVLYEALKKAGLSLSDVNLVNTSPTVTIPAFMSGKAQIISGWDPGLSDILAKSKGAKLLAGDRMFYPQVSLPGIWTASNAMVKKPVTLEKFTWAMMQAMTYKSKNMSQTVDWTSQLTGVDGNLLTGSVKDSIFLTGPQLVKDTKNGSVRHWFNTLAATFVAMHALPKAPGYTSYFLPNIIPMSIKKPK